jgi:5-methylcytosine-specific restriction endonuclease McrA
MKKRDYRSEYQNYQGNPEQLKNRAERNAARRELMSKGVVKVGDGKDVDHKRPISKGGGNASDNLRVLGKSANRSFPRTKSGKMR